MSPASNRGSERDKDLFVAMLNKAGVFWEEGVSPEVIVIPAELEETQELHPKNKGYSGFFAIFVFAEDGQLESVGVWE